jgi:xylulokinase
MTDGLFLGIDIGTQGSKGVVTDRHGRVLAQHFIEHPVLHPQAGWAEQDPEKHWWGDAATIARQVLADAAISAGRVNAVCVSGLIPDFAPTDGEGRPLCNAILYSDNRAVAEVDEINREFGLGITTEEISPKLLWFMRNRPELARDMRMMFNAHSYVVFRLTGEYTTDTVTACYWGAIYSSTRAQWRTDACEKLGIPMDVLPPAYPPAQVVGHVTREAAAATGLAPGTPVLAGSGDIFFSVLGAGVTEVNEIVVYYGTAGLVISLAANLDSLARRPLDLDDTVPLPFLSYQPTSGEVIRWFRDELAESSSEEALGQGLSPEQLLDKKASGIPPGADGLICIPHLLGQRSPVFDPLARGALVGLTIAHSSAHLFKAILESYGFGIRRSLEKWPGPMAKVDRVVATGGGAASEVWRQIVSDITGLEQEYVAAADAPVGDAYLAAHAMGAVDKLSDMKSSWLQPTSPTQPDLGAHARYERLYRVFCNLDDVLRPSFHELSAIAEEIQLGDVAPLRRP